MNTMEILKLACTFTDNLALKQKLDESGELTQEEEGLVATLVDCLNLVQNEIACQYIPIEKIESVKIKDFKVSYADLSSRPIAVVWVKDKFGRNIRFKALDDHLVAFASCGYVKYNALPEKIEDSAGALSQPLVPTRIYAYGVAREYFLLQSLTDEADIWEVRFKDSLQAFVSKKKEVRLPCRRWL